MDLDNGCQLRSSHFVHLSQTIPKRAFDLLSREGLKLHYETDYKAYQTFPVAECLRLCLSLFLTFRSMKCKFVGDSIRVVIRREMCERKKK